MKFLYLSTAAVNNSLENCGLCEISAVLTEELPGKPIREISAFHSTMRPNTNEVFADDVVPNTGYSLGQIATFESSNFVFSKFQNWLENHIDKFNREDKAIIVGYAAEYHYSKLKNWFAAHKATFFGSYFYHQPICVMNLAIYAFRFNRNKFPNFTLNTVCIGCGVTVEDSVNKSKCANAGINLRNLYYYLTGYTESQDIELIYRDEIEETI